jgi:YesN/AraC family two-component response regulator
VVVPLRPLEDLTEMQVPEAPRINAPAEHKRKRPMVLLVEDNEDFSEYLRVQLAPYFDVETADNGKTGWQKVLSYHPDIVISDISMPIMDGLTLCRKIKADKRTRNVPVILLTAFGDEKILDSFKGGAADFISKPFRFERLLVRVQNILDEYALLTKALTKKVDVQVADIKVESPSEKFVVAMLEHIDEHLSDSGFSVAQLGRLMCMSRVNLYKRALELTGTPPLESIRNRRLERAAQLLLKADMTVAEVAYAVGFNDPKYFAKVFRLVYKVAPSEYKVREQKV